MLYSLYPTRMITTIKLPNKPLCMVEHNSSLYIGDARGNIFKLERPYKVPKVYWEAPGPVSAITFLNEMYFGTWDGIVYTKDKSMKLGSNRVYSMAAWNGYIFVSVDKKLFVLDGNLSIIEEYNLQSKIFCMCARDEYLEFGMEHGLISKYTESYEPGIKSLHDTSILSIKNGVSGCTYGRVVDSGNIIYDCGDEWVRSVYNASLFAVGKSVIRNNVELYKHDDNVVGVLEISNCIISIGLDYCYKIYEDGFKIDSNEENELMELLNS